MQKMLVAWTMLIRLSNMKRLPPFGFSAPWDDDAEKLATCIDSHSHSPINTRPLTLPVHGSLVNTRHHSTRK